MRLAILSLVFSATLLALGCGANSSPTTPPDPKVAEARDKISDASKATVEAAKAKRDEYARAMHKRLDELTVKYEELKVRAAKAEGQMKTELEKKLEEAKVKRDVAAKKLDELKEASHDRWEKVKDGVESAFEDLKKGVE
jgi:TolA-binding protein